MQSAAPATTLQAKVAMPAGLHAAAAAAAKPAPAALSADDVMVPVNETVVENNVPTAEVNTVEGTVKYTVLGAEPVTSPKLIKTTPIVLSLADMRASSDVSTVTVHLTVGKDGVPTSLTVVHSGGAAIDRRALAAVSQYRFKPATQNELPIEAPVDVQIKVKKS
jgi:TonB family protein